ncbi:hypothetical protein RNZ50_08900 [Paracoccaceae bacterium Fryx2]|nr:hypothetical protein [Paracoccaceae bacterium Fryx2]
MTERQAVRVLAVGQTPGCGCFFQIFAALVLIGMAWALGLAAIGLALRVRPEPT